MIKAGVKRHPVRHVARSVWTQTRHGLAGGEVMWVEQISCISYCSGPSINVLVFQVPLNYIIL